MGLGCEGSPSSCAHAPLGDVGNVPDQVRAQGKHHLLDIAMLPDALQVHQLLLQQLAVIQVVLDTAAAVAAPGVPQAVQLLRKGPPFGVAGGMLHALLDMAYLLEALVELLVPLSQQPLYEGDGDQYGCRSRVSGSGRGVQAARALSIGLTHCDMPFADFQGQPLPRPGPQPMRPSESWAPEPSDYFQEHALDP